MRGAARMTIVLLLLAGSVGSSYAQRAAAGTSREPRQSKPPVLRMAVNTALAPAFTCADEGCRLTSVVLVHFIGTPESGALLDSADQSAYAADVLRRTAATWRFRIAGANGDPLLHDLSIDSVQFVYGYDPRRDLGGPAMSPTVICARGELRDPAFLSALSDGSSLTVLAENPSARSRNEQQIWLPDATRWMRRVQEAQRQLTAARSTRPGPAERRNAGAGQR